MLGDRVRAGSSPEWPPGLRERPPLTDSDADELWHVLQGGHAGTALTVRIATAYRHDDERRQRAPIRIGMATPFERNFGPLDVELRHALEDELLRRVGDRGVLVAALTTPHMWEVVFHTDDRGWIADTHAELEIAFEPYRLQLIVEDDPEWSVYFDLLSHTPEAEP